MGLPRLGSSVGAALTGLLLPALAIAGCGAPVEKARTTPAGPATTEAAGMARPPAAATTARRVYFLRDEKIAAADRLVPATEQVGTAAMRKLIEGPSRQEREAGLVSSIPGGTRLLGLAVEDGVATVNLSKEFESGGGSFSMTARVAQVVYTLTQFPSVRTVRLELEGRPVESIGGEGVVVSPPTERSSYEDLTPAILVETPTVGGEVRSPLRVAGTANTFEATFTVRVVDARGRVLAEQVVTATSGSGTRGTFDVTVPFELERAGPGKLIALEPSAEDGSLLHVVEIPLRLAP